MCNMCSCSEFFPRKNVFIFWCSPLQGMFKVSPQSFYSSWPLSERVYMTQFTWIHLSGVSKHTHVRETNSLAHRWAPSFLHMTSVRCQLLSEACLPTWLHRRTCWVPAVGLLYMAGIIPTSWVPLPLEPFMWLQEEKSLSVKKSFAAGAVMQRVWTHWWTDLHKHRAGTVVIWAGGSVVMESLLDLETVQFSQRVHCSRYHEHGRGRLHRPTNSWLKSGANANLIRRTHPQKHLPG